MEAELDLLRQYHQHLVDQNLDYDWATLFQARAPRMRLEMSQDKCVGVCLDMRLDLSRDMCVCRHASRNVPRQVCRHSEQQVAAGATVAKEKGRYLSILFCWLTP